MIMSATALVTAPSPSSGSPSSTSTFDKLLALLPPTKELADQLASAEHCGPAIFAQSDTVLRQFAATDRPFAQRAHLRLDALKDKLFEAINTGHWSRVDPVVRKAYTLATFSSALHTIAAGAALGAASAAKIVFHLDRGLMLGCPLGAPHDQLLSEAIRVIGDDIPVTADCRPPFAPIARAVRSADETTRNDIPVLRRPTLEQFERDHFRPQVPAILTDCMDLWPAMQRWCDAHYLLDCAADRTVPIEIGASYTQADWSQELQRFGDFLRRHVLSEASTSGDRSGKHIEYLAQHNLFDQIPALRGDLIVPEYCCLTSTTTATSATPAVDIRAWLGPAGTVSPAHTDPKHNLLCQVFGHKQVLLAAPEHGASLYPHAGAMLHNTSQVDAECVDGERFPLAREVPWLRTRLYRGEMLYLPPGWWHHVRALDRSFSVSFWWD